MAACGGDDGGGEEDAAAATVRVWVYPSPGAIVFHDAAGNEVPHTLVEQELYRPWLYEAAGADGVTAGWLDASNPPTTIRRLQTVRGLVTGDEIHLHRDAADRPALPEDGESPFMTVGYTRTTAYEHTLTTPCQRLVVTPQTDPVLRFPPGCLSGDTFDLLITARIEGSGFTGVEARAQPLVDGGHVDLTGTSWMAGATLAMQANNPPADAVTIEWGHATVSGDFAVADVRFRSPQPIASASSLSMPVLRAGHGAYRTVMVERAATDPGGVAVTEVVATHDDTWQVDLSGPQPPRIDGVIAGDAQVSWTRGAATAGDARVVDRTDGSAGSWTLLEADAGDTSALPALPAAFDDMRLQGELTTTVRVIDVEGLDGYTAFKPRAHELVDLRDYRRRAGLGGLAPLRVGESFGATLP